ncbi:MAG: transposase [Planctomycetota bacterium]|jgi:REP element-mobilizing transposase RayT
MPRKARIEYGGAAYHVLNRGNYRQDIFAVPGSADAFEKALFDCCSRFGWRLFAYVVMSNHYHCCFRTEDANLVAGMQWLQSTFANRFNRFVHDHGHVFQGRYKALLIEDGPSVLRVVNYIHLNPVRAGIETVETLKRHSCSSFPKFFVKKRPACLDAGDWLATAGDLKPTSAGMRRYHESLKYTIESDPKKRSDLFKELCRGWYIGTREGRKALLEDIETRLLANDRPGSLRGFGEERAETLLQEGLIRLGRDERELASDRKLAHWKVVLASWIKLQCGVGNRWFSENLHMGNIYSISKAVAAETKTGRKRSREWTRLDIPKSKA